MLARHDRKRKRASKGVMLRIKLDVIKHVWYDFVGYFLGLGTLKIFSI